MASEVGGKRGMYALIYRAEAIYTRADGTLRLPYVDVVKYRDDQFYDYRVFIDTKLLVG